MKRAVFLDRDGVITEDPPHYAHRIDQLSIIAGSAEAICLLNEHEFLVIVITNQSGVARGMYSEEDVQIFHNEMKKQLASKGAYIDAIFYCPHHSDSIIPEYKVICDCRKPKPGMIFSAVKDMDISLRNSYLVGDKWSDIEAGKTAGCRTILVMTGHGYEEYTLKIGDADFIAGNLLIAVNNIIL